MFTRLIATCPPHCEAVGWELSAGYERRKKGYTAISYTIAEAVKQELLHV
jgi:hypothetical protein